MEDRYTGRPFLRLIECLALDAIDALDPVQREALEKMAPQLAESLDHQGTWQEIVAAQMQWGEGIGDAIREVWERNSALAQDVGITLTADEFAMLFADANTDDGEA
ncbi:hypothetical protein LYSHEL_09870 [Lysobacter helvus]|uniref:Uncharacterized protein n=2 Tax=Lysobacteraceae TaxID=32033 RepID=A0ABM7Q3Z9_9GAMM|nr:MULTISPECIES: hypothetical protein [Lysobacter]BCT91963.1 hypothetical protein LYSCAS_09870 [Lysobacter caseinilyticus]BCT95116.1 hypothetical protein LYSHEL_09870 [Lysobacter helvus]